MASEQDITIYLDPSDADLSKQLEELTGEPALTVDRADGFSDLLVHTLEFGTSGLNVLAAYLAIKSASSRSHIKRGFIKKPLTKETVEQLKDESAD